MGHMVNVSSYTDFYLTFNSTQYTLFYSEGTSELGLFIFFSFGDDGGTPADRTVIRRGPTGTWETFFLPGSSFVVFFADAGIEHQLLSCGGVMRASTADFFTRT
jgi:hypothetical protein